MKKSLFPLVILLLISGTNDLFSQEFNPKTLEKSLVKIPTGRFFYGIEKIWNTKSNYNIHLMEGQMDSLLSHPEVRAVDLESFYIGKYELSNEAYRLFLADIRKKDPAFYLKMLPDTMRDFFTFSEPILDNYHFHPAFNESPVIGVSHEQATAYCEWLTQRYLKEENRKFDKVEFKLPSADQWTYAAMGGKEFSQFPWPGSSLWTKKKDLRANFQYVAQTSISRRTIPVEFSSDSTYLQTVLVASGYGGGTNLEPVHSFEPNGFGLYNMAGNVEEYVKKEGITKGGSFNDPAYYLQTWVEEKYDPAHIADDERGFRIVMEVMD